MLDLVSPSKIIRYFCHSWCDFFRERQSSLALNWTREYFKVSIQNFSMVENKAWLETMSEMFKHALNRVIPYPVCAQKYLFSI